MHAKQFGSNINLRRRFGSEMKNKLAEEGWTTCLSWVLIPIFLILCKSLNTKFYLSLHSGSNVWQIQQWPCWQLAIIQNWNWEVQRSKLRSKIAGKCTMPSFCTGLHYWTRTIVNCHPQKALHCGVLFWKAFLAFHWTQYRHRVILGNIAGRQIQQNQSVILFNEEMR